MEELLGWLREQNGGVATYIGLQQKAAQLASAQPEHAALFTLLSGLAGRFVGAYDGMPLSVDVARTAFDRTLGLVERAAMVMSGPADERLDLLNTVARTEFADDRLSRTAGNVSH